MNKLWENPGRAEISVVDGLDLQVSKVLSTLTCSDSMTMALNQWYWHPTF